MNFALVEQIANAVLYEGYMLYPYRPSAVKNRQRWTFGGIYPQSYSIAQEGTDAWTMQTECLVSGRGDSRTAPTLDVKARFLHIMAREVGELTHPTKNLPNDIEPDFRIIRSLQVGDKLFSTWQEAVEREVAAISIDLGRIAAQPERLAFAFPPRRESEPLRSPAGEVVGLLIWSQEPLEGAVEISAECIEDRVFKVTVRILNLTPIEEGIETSRDEALMRSLISTHTILGVEGGEFVSLLDPPERFREIAGCCSNVGTWPVLVGEDGERDAMLSSPIILYDYPQIAPESAGDLFDGTEIDEILTLRIMTLTEDEKKEIRAFDDRARALLERTESLSAEQLMKLHGTVRSIRPLDNNQEELMSNWNPLEDKPRLDHIEIGGVELRPGDRVRLRPQGRADIFDVALQEKTGAVESIEQDYEDKVYIVVTVDEDPGKEFGIGKMPGHRFFFSPEEIEPLRDEEARGL